MEIIVVFVSSLSELLSPSRDYDSVEAVNSHSDDDQHSITLEQLLAYFDTLAERYELVPTTLAGAHQHYRQLMAAGEAPVSVLKLGE